jgi:NADH-quinone oxidoreductase subunit G
VRRLVDGFDVTAAVQVPLGDEAPLAAIPNLALRRERAPNLAGAELLGYTPQGETALRQVLAAAVVIVLDAELSPADEAALAAAPGMVIVLGTVAADGLRNAELVLPVTSMAEENGTYVNRDRRVQRFQQAKSQPGMARPAWWVAGEVLTGPGPSADAPSTAAEAFALLGERWPVFAGLTHADLGFTGRVLQGAAGPAYVEGGAALSGTEGVVR